MLFAAVLSRRGQAILLIPFACSFFRGLEDAIGYNQKRVFPRILLRNVSTVWQKGSEAAVRKYVQELGIEKD
mgnify:CR=1 FL=1